MSRSKSPLLPTLDFSKPQQIDEKTDGFLSTREFTSGTLQFSSSNNLKSLLAEMDVVRSEVEEKIRKSSRKEKNPCLELRKSKEEEYWEKVKELEKQNLLMLKMIRPIIGGLPP